MKFFKALLPTLMMVAMFSFTQLSAESSFLHHTCDLGDISRHDNEITQKDWQELYDFINTKRTITLAEKSNNLTIAGDVRVVWRHINEKSREEIDSIEEYVSLHGGDATDYNGLRTGRNYFDAVFNLYFDYVCDRSWTVVQLEFDNTMGVAYNDNDYEASEIDYEGLHGSGFCCDLCLKKAYIGYNICCGGDSRFDIEIGRRHFYHVFDSEVEFLSRFDGILLRYTGAWDCAFDYHVYLGGFVIDERVNHFGWITEVGVSNICNSSFDVKYSFIDWNKFGRNRYHTRNPIGARFMVSQLLVKYHLDPSLTWCNPSHFYGAYLWNCDAHRANINHNHRRNRGWYVGYRIGEVFEQGDWGFDIQYQYVEAQVIPDQDISGIGRGNYNDETLTLIGRGNGNYKGWRAEYLYAITNNLTLDASLEASKAADKNIGGPHSFSQLEVEVIYAF